MKISVIIPIYNKEPYLEMCLNSVINQTYSNLEIILINDGSTDNSLTICNLFTFKDKRIQIIDQKNAGVSAARNKGINLAGGNWIYFLDADDFLELDAFESIVNEIIQDNQIDLVEFGTQKWKDGILVGKRVPSKKQIFTDNIKFIMGNELKPFSACFHLIKKELLIENKIQFDEDLKHNEDMLFMFKIFLNSKKALVMDEIFYNIVFSSDSATRSEVKKIRLINNLQYIDRLLNYTNEKQVTNQLISDLVRIPNYFFVSFVFYKDGLKDLREFQNLFNQIYDEHKEVLNVRVLRLARIHFLLILVPLFFKFRIFKRNYQL